jgi:uncharacterized protein YbaR (Trm112 family)
MTMNSEENRNPKFRLCQWCPMCKQFVKDVRFKNHLLTHWVKGGGKGKEREEYADFIRRIYKSRAKIPFVLIDEIL